MVLPLCRCRVLYIGSAVPTITKDGLQGIQQPLRERYPVEDTPETRGIDSWLSVWSNGILLEYIEGDKKSESIFFPINTLHYCAAVRYVNVTGYAVEGGGERFLPLDSPFADIPDSPHPPIFAAILRRTSGVKVLECHGFICSNAKAANALVRCCFHAYADCMYLKMDEKLPGLKAIKNQEGSTGERSPASPQSDENISVEAEEHHRPPPSGWERRQQEGEYDSVSISSSMLRHNKPASESGARHHALVPFEAGGPRRAGSDADISSFRDPHFPPFMVPPPPHRLPPGVFPPHPMFRGGPPPPGHHLPPHFFPPGPFPPPPPPNFRGGPPPFMWGPPPPHHRGFFHPPPHFMPPFRPPSPEGSGPIITGPESIYGTMRRSAYEEPAYVTGGPPESSYQPANFNHDHFEAYYDTLKKKDSKKGSVSGGKDVWEQFEAGIYRKPQPHERAFSTTLRETAEKETMSATLKRGGKEESVTQTATADVIRPDTPPVDYDSRNGMVRAH